MEESLNFAKAPEFRSDKICCEVQRMCEVCKSEGKDYRFINGSKRYIYPNVLYKVYKNSVASVRLCYVHSIELFMMGEKRFLREHIFFARRLASRSKNLTAAEESPFGF